VCISVAQIIRSTMASFLICCCLSFLIISPAFGITPELAFQDKIFQNLNNNDVVYGTDLIFELATRSEIDCARRCSVQQECLTFTFTPSSRSCRGHSKVKNQSEPGLVSVGAVTYVGMLTFCCYIHFLVGFCTCISVC
jgi:hypothetical protein